MKDLYLEACSRRENIKFSKITEFTPGDPRGEDTEEVLRIFLEKEMGYADSRTVEILRIYRLGKKRDTAEPRPILARFLCRLLRYSFSRHPSPRN